VSKRDRQQQPTGEAGPHERILDWAEAGLWIVLLVVGTLVGLEVMRDAATRVRPMEARGPAPTGLTDAEDLSVIAKNRDFLFWRQGTSVFPSGRWSKDGHMFAQNTEKGDWVDLELPEREPGRYLIELFMTKAADYGIIAVSLNGARVGTFDLYSGRGVVPTGALELGELELRGSEDVLRLEVEATNPRASMPFFQFGIDGIRFSKRVPGGGGEDAESAASGAPDDGPEAGGKDSDPSVPEKE
jgi:hypothetical protein